MKKIFLEDDSLENLQLKINEYYEKWPSAGYGTYIRDPKYDNILKKYTAQGVRSDTCD